MTAAIPVARGCGTRKPGGCYAECGLSPNGMPIEYFLVDPPTPIDNLRVSRVGVQLIEIGGISHILDVVGREHYPNVADMVEEIRRFGLSRRLPGAGSALDYSKLTPQSRILLAHDRAFIANSHEWPNWGCPKGHAHHFPVNRALLAVEEPDKRACLGVCWQDIEGGEPVIGEMGAVRRKMPSFEYEAMSRPEEIEPQYRLAIFGSFPISRLVTIAGGKKTDCNYQEIQKSSLPTAIAQE